MSDRPQLLSGARGLIQSIDAQGNVKTLAVATDVSLNIRHGVRSTFVVGRTNAAAIDTTSYDVDVSIGRIVPINKSNDTAPDPTASSIDLGLEPQIVNMLIAEDITIAIQDRITGKYIGAVRNARFAGRGFNMTAADIANERYSFIGIYDSGYDGENAAQTGYGV